jgi:hypothetical protein
MGSLLTATAFDELFTAIENSSEWLTISSPKELIAEHPATSRIYLPSTGPADHAWINAMAKHPEANHIHKKMLQASRKLSDALLDDEAWDESHEKARKSLFRGQCNDAYWPYAGQGLCQAHLRQAVYGELIAAETILDNRLQGDDDWISFDRLDFSAERREQLLVENSVSNVYINPKGGVVSEWDHRPQAINLVDLLCVPTGHNQKRDCFIDRILDPQTTLEDLKNQCETDNGDFAHGEYTIEQVGIDEDDDCDFEVLMKRTGTFKSAGIHHPLEIEKLILVPPDQAAIYVHYELKNPSQNPVDLIFSPELNLSLPQDLSDRQTVEFGDEASAKVNSAGGIEDASWMALVDPAHNIQIEINISPATTIWRYPVESFHLTTSEKQHKERQGFAVAPRWEMTLPAKKAVQLSLQLLICEAQEESTTVPTTQAESEVSQGETQTEATAMSNQPPTTESPDQKKQESENPEATAHASPAGFHPGRA